MKTEKIIVRISTDERKQLNKATKKFHKETGAKESISATIRHAVRQYNASTAG